MFQTRLSEKKFVVIGNVEECYKERAYYIMEKENYVVRYNVKDISTFLL